jgi:hypothetical protein
MVCFTSPASTSKGFGLEIIHKQTTMRANMFPVRNLLFLPFYRVPKQIQNHLNPDYRHGKMLYVYPNDSSYNSRS